MMSLVGGGFSKMKLRIRFNYSAGWVEQYGIPFRSSRCLNKRNN